MLPKLFFTAALHGGVFILAAIFLETQSATPGAGFLIAFLFIALGGLVYLLPTYIAALRNAPRFAGIFGLNLLAGWTGLGWLATLIWSFVDAKKEAPQVIIQQIYQTPQSPPPIPQQTKPNDD